MRSQVIHGSRVAVFFAVVAAMCCSGGLAGGGTAYQMAVVPDELAPGEEFTVSNKPGSECFPNGKVSGFVADFPVSYWETTADANGNWSKRLYVPESIGTTPSGEPIPTPPGVYSVADVRCEAETGGTEAITPVIEYEDAPFTVVAPRVTPPATDTAPGAVELQPNFPG